MAFIEDWLNRVFSDVGVFDAIKVTFVMALSSTVISSILGIFWGMFLERKSFKGKRLIIRVNRTMMGIPPVVVGLLVYLLIMRRGPLGSLGWLFTMKGMVLAQTLIITPIVCGMIYSYASKTAPGIRNFAITRGANKRQTKILLLKEMKNEIYFAVITGFGLSLIHI